MIKGQHTKGQGKKYKSMIEGQHTTGNIQNTGATYKGETHNGQNTNTTHKSHRVHTAKIPKIQRGKNKYKRKNFFLHLRRRIFCMQKFVCK